MAAPQVTGAIALLRSEGYTAEGAVARLLQTTDPVGCGTASPTCHGRINLDQATSR
jgi:hypothetical protein